MKIGIIGAGNFAVKRHIPEILQFSHKVQLVSVCRRNISKLKLIGNKFNIKSLYVDHIRMLKSETLDTVLISSPHSLHYQHAIDCLNYNCNVIIEKPITASTDQLKKLIQLSKIKKKKIIPLFNPPFESHQVFLKKFILNKKNFGNLEHISIMWSDNKDIFFKKKIKKKNLGLIPPTNFRYFQKLSCGGILNDSGCHLVAEIIWLLKKKPKSVFSTFNNLKKELSLSIILEFHKSLFVNININGKSKLMKRRVTSLYVGSKKLLRLTGTPYKIIIDEKKIRNFNVYDYKTKNTPIKEAYKCIYKNKKPDITLKDALIIGETIENIYKSARSQKKEKLIK